MMSKHACSQCTCHMEWKDEQWVCPLCGHSEFLAPNKGYCETHICVVDLSVFRLWQSVCFACSKQQTCNTYRLGKEWRPNGQTPS